MSTPISHPDCSFCKIIEGDADSCFLRETDRSCAFLAYPPVTECHTLVIPKYHAVKMHELPDEYLADLLAVAKDIVLSEKFENYNIIQNNGKIAYQTINHVHFHIINRPDEDHGLVVQWPERKSDKEIEEDRARFFKEKGVKGKTWCRPRTDR